MSNVYFENLNGVRTIAFAFVFIGHIIGFNPFLTASTKSLLCLFFPNAYFGVSLFFVLSGFLITYLLIDEKNETGKIDLWGFYKRRILRIWPLFFLVLFIGFFVLPFIFQSLTISFEKFLYYPFFLVNFSILAHYTTNPMLEVLWSVSVEEPFYWVWPMLLVIVPQKSLFNVMFLLFLVSLFFTHYYFIRYDNFPYSHYHTLGTVSDLALGGVSAVLSFRKDFLLILKGLTPPMIKAVYLVGMLLLSLWGFLDYQKVLIFRSVAELFISIFFAFIIIEQNYSNGSFIKLKDSKALSKFGTYTYGLYCYHLICAFLVIKCLGTLEWSNSIKFPLSVFLSLSLSALVSYFCYENFERHILKYKYISFYKSK